MEKDFNSVDYLRVKTHENINWKQQISETGQM